MHKYIVELFGTFLLAIAVTWTGNPIAIGLILAAAIVIGGHISGGHYNPAVSLALFMRNKLSSYDLGLYMLAQTGGAFCAVLLFYILTGTVFSADIAPELPLWIALFMEMVLTMTFALVILTLVCQHYAHADNSTYSSSFNQPRTGSFTPVNLHNPMLIGFTLVSIAFIGGLFNPAIGAASIINGMLKGGTADQMQQLLVHVVAPLVGGAVASLAYGWLHSDHKHA